MTAAAGIHVDCETLVGILDETSCWYRDIISRGGLQAAAGGKA